MKPSKGIDSLTSSWNLWVECYKRQLKGLSRDDSDIPLRMRGYIELTMSELTDRERKSIDTALRRGYSLTYSTRWYSCLRHILKSVDFNIGYVGKTRSNLWFPTKEMRDRCIRLMEAQLVMTKKFSAASMNKRFDNQISIHVGRTQRGQPMKAHLTELRIVVDEFMAEWAAEREALANKIAADDAVIRIPFDSFRERENK